LGPTQNFQSCSIHQNTMNLTIFSYHDRYVNCSSETCISILMSDPCRLQICEKIFSFPFWLYDFFTNPYIKQVDFETSRSSPELSKNTEKNSAERENILLFFTIIVCFGNIDIFAFFSTFATYISKMTNNLRNCKIYVFSDFSVYPGDEETYLKIKQNHYYIVLKKMCFPWNLNFH